MTHVIRPWAECEAVIATKEEYMMFFEAGPLNIHSHYADGVRRLNETSCLVGLHRIRSSSPRHSHNCVSSCCLFASGNVQ